MSSPLHLILPYVRHEPHSSKFYSLRQIVLALPSFVWVRILRGHILAPEGPKHKAWGCSRGAARAPGLRPPQFPRPGGAESAFLNESRGFRPFRARKIWELLTWGSRRFAATAPGFTLRPLQGQETESTSLRRLQRSAGVDVAPQNRESAHTKS